MPIKNYLSLLKTICLHFKVDNLKITKYSRDVFLYLVKLKRENLID